MKSNVNKHQKGQAWEVACSFKEIIKTIIKNNRNNPVVDNVSLYS